VGIKKYAYQIKIIDHDYIHPYLKPVNNNAMRFYFSIRNQLFSFLKNSKKNRQLFIVLFFYLRTALDRILIERNSQILVSFSLAIRDFLQNKFSFQNNQQIIQKSITKKTEKNQEMRTTLEEFSQITKNLYSNQFFLTLTGTDIEKIHASHKIDDFFKH
jgi:hypothetical protein